MQVVPSPQQPRNSPDGEYCFFRSRGAEWLIIARAGSEWKVAADSVMFADVFVVESESSADVVQSPASMSSKVTMAELIIPCVFVFVLLNFRVVSVATVQPTSYPAVLSSSHGPTELEADWANTSGLTPESEH